MERNNVLLKITDLRQYFPVGKKKGLYVKANDGISLNIYEGETVGLVGESGCGKSTFGRTLLELYRQTDGKTMYYGASRDELAPEYIEKTIRHLPHGLHELAALEKKRDEMQKVYDAADEQKRLHMHNDLTAAKKAANDAYLNIVNVIGGFITAKDLGPVMKIFSERHDRCCDLHKAIEKRAPVKLNYDEEAFKLSKLKAGERGYDSRKGKLDKLAEKVAAHDKLVEAARAEIAKVDARIDAMRAKYAADPEFQKHEALLDNGIDLARLTYPEVRTLRCQMQYIFQDPYSSLNPRMTVANIIGEGLLAHKYCKKANERMHEEILQTMEDCGLAPYFLHRYPHQFSGGQRQRIGIARSLAVHPKFVVCDEAVSALDVSIQSQIINLLQDLKEQQVQDPAHHDIAHIAEQGVAAVQVQVERRLSEVDAGPENGLRRAIEPRLPFQHELERKAEAHRHRQDLLEPDVHGADHGSLAEAEREDLQNDGSQRQGRGDPGQRVFPADIKTGLLFHVFPLFLGNL